MDFSHFFITSLQVMPEYKLRLIFGDGLSATVDISGLICNPKPYKALKSKTLFAKAVIQGTGGHIEWTQVIAISSDHLRHLAIEQAGGIGHERLWTWRHKSQLSVCDAAKALGITESDYCFVTSGRFDIPRQIWAKCQILVH